MNIETLGKTIRARRRVLRISQRDAAELAGVSVHTLSDIESGKGNPTFAVLEQILRPLGLEIRVEVAS